MGLARLSIREGPGLYCKRCLDRVFYRTPARIMPFGAQGPQRVPSCGIRFFLYHGIIEARCKIQHLLRHRIQFTVTSDWLFDHIRLSLPARQ